MSLEFSCPEFDCHGVKILTRAGDVVNDSMMDIAVYRLSPGETRAFLSPDRETAVLLVQGKVSFAWQGRRETGTRGSFIDEGPCPPHVSRGAAVTAEAESEVLVQRTENGRAFPAVFYRPEDCREDIFGEGVPEGKPERTVFDYKNAPWSNTVSGEVINHQGGWSGCTPHHHPQVTAPAYPMYYCRMIRHLPGNPWTDRIVDPRCTWIDAKMK